MPAFKRERRVIAAARSHSRIAKRRHELAVGPINGAVGRVQIAAAQAAAARTNLDGDFLTGRAGKACNDAVSSFAG